MSTAPVGWTAPVTSWAASDAVDESDFNRIEGNANATELGDRTIDDSQVPASDTGTLREFLDWIPNRIKEITGQTNWYDDPGNSLADNETLIWFAQ